MDDSSTLSTVEPCKVIPLSPRISGALHQMRPRDLKIDGRQIEPVVTEVLMRLMSLVRALSLFLATCTAASAPAQERAPAAAGTTAALPLDATSPAPRAVTGKERLGGKWMDEQRIDNCKVPNDKRGTQPR